MKILVLNCGSSSVKYQLIETQKEECLAKGLAERIGLENSLLTHKPAGKEPVCFEEGIEDYDVTISRVIELLCHPDSGVIKSLDEIAAVGHRFVNGGARFPFPVKLTDEILAELYQVVDIAPLHNPNHLLGIEACRRFMPATPQVIVFDSAFHIQGMPDHAYIYAIPYSYYDHYSIRKYGFHGISHKYVSQRSAELLGKPLENLCLITCHLGNGSSMTAIKYGKSLETSMGYTPLEGLVMGTRSGDIDPAAVLKIMNLEGFTTQDMLSLLNTKSGLMGISGISPDMREIIFESKQGNRRAELAFKMFCYRIKKTIGSYAAVMGGVDAVVFTAGIGENSPEIRQGCLEGCEFLGIVMDYELNSDVNASGERDISSKGSKCKILIIPTNEEIMIARETVQVLTEHW